MGTQEWVWQERHRARFSMYILRSDWCHCCPALQMRRQRLRDFK